MYSKTATLNWKQYCSQKRQTEGKVVLNYLRYIFGVHSSIYSSMPYLTSNLNTLFFLCAVIVVVVCNSLGNYHTSVIVFLEESNSDVKEIVLNAVERYSSDHKHGSLETDRARMNFSFVSYNRTVNSILYLDQGHLTSLRFAIFLHVSSHEIILSSIMKRLNIVPIGLFQTDEIPTTQVRFISLYFSLIQFWHLPYKELNPSFLEITACNGFSFTQRR